MHVSWFQRTYSIFLILSHFYIPKEKWSPLLFHYDFNIIIYQNETEIDWLEFNDTTIQCLDEEQTISNFYVRALVFEF